MAEANLKAKAKAATTPFTLSADPFKFEMPKFDVASMEVPAAYREIAEKSIEQAKQGYDKMKVAAEEASDVMEATYTTAAKGATNYGLKLIETFRANANANFDFARDLMTVKSFSEAIELSSAHTRQQFETLSAQTKELTTLAQKVTSETAEPAKSGFTKAFKQVA